MSNFWKSIEGQSVEYDLIMKVYRHILNYASETERASIEFDRFFPTAGFRANVDLYLGNGVAKLGWNGKTAIEIKSYLDSRSLTMSIKHSRRLQKTLTGSYLSTIEPISRPHLHSRTSARSSL